MGRTFVELSMQINLKDFLCIAPILGPILHSRDVGLSVGGWLCVTLIRCNIHNALLLSDCFQVSHENDDTLIKGQG